MKKLNELLGTEFPIIQGGMANIATGEFAAACSNAGALGVIATGGMLEADLLRQQGAEHIRRPAQAGQPSGLFCLPHRGRVNSFLFLFRWGMAKGYHPFLSPDRAYFCRPAEYFSVFIILDV